MLRVGEGNTVTLELNGENAAVACSVAVGLTF